MFFHLPRLDRGLLGSAIRILLVLVPLLVFFLSPSSRASREPENNAKPSAQKPQRPEFIAGQILVRYRSEAIARRQQNRMTIPLREGGTILLQVRSFEGAKLVPGLRLAQVAAEDTMSAIESLKEQPDVVYAEPNYIMHADVTPNDPSFPSLYGLTKIGATTAWNTTTGSNNIVVGVIDEGIQIDHPDLQANIFNNPAPGSIPGITGDLHGYDFVDNSGTISPGDHGTHTSGTVGAVGNNGIGVVGVNWQVKLMSLRFLSSGGGSDSDAVRAYTYAKQMRDLYVSSGGSQGANIRVLNNSYGGAGFSQASLDAIRALNDSGILFVASEGNDGVDTDLNPHYPSGYDSPNLISVAATDSNDNLASFSNFGAQTGTMGAPGAGILSTITGNSYQSLSGTSMATPHVTGAAALLLAQNPNLTVQQLKWLLLFNGDLVGSLNGKTQTGRRLNVANSLAALAENDITPPGTVTNLHINSQNGRSFNLGWTASGDDGAAGQASLYQVIFTDGVSSAVLPLANVLPTASGTGQTLDVKLPYRHTSGTFTVLEFDNVGLSGTPAVINVSVDPADGDPYSTALSSVEALSTGGIPLNFNCDDCFKESFALPLAAPFPFFGQNYTSVALSSNGNIYFNGHGSHDVPSSVAELSTFRMISGLWDDLDLRTINRADADVYMLHPEPNRVIFRWQGVPCNDNGAGCTGGAPINFEIELNSTGVIKTRYGTGNTNIFPVVGIAGGEPEAYDITTHTSESTPANLTNAETVTYTPVIIGPIAAISGQLRYANGTTLAKNVTLTLTGPPEFSPRQRTTDNSGNYSFTNLPEGPNYTLTPSKTAGVNGITAFDASQAARFPLNLISLTSNQQIAADASNNGSVTAFDASEIARTALGIPNPGIAGTWKFLPASLTFNSLTADQLNQNITAILVGDVSGNWTPAGPSGANYRSGPVVTLPVSLPVERDPGGGPSRIPITVGDTTGAGVFAYDLDVEFNQAVLQPQVAAFDAAGTLSSGWNLNVSTSTPGHVIINAFSTSAMNGQGVLLYLKFNVIGGAGSTSALTWHGFHFNEGDPADSAVNGQFTVASSSTANGIIAGRITNAAGVPVEGAVVRLNGAQSRKTITNALGNYQFDKVETGGRYTVTPSRANYNFNPLNREFTGLGKTTEALFTGTSLVDNENPLDTAEYFVRQQYLDVLGREPEEAGFNYWSDQILACAQDANCTGARRDAVAAAFFIENEFQITGSFIYDAYSTALGRRPAFAEYAADRQLIVGGGDLEAAKVAFADNFIRRAEFLTRYESSLTAESFVDKLLANTRAAGSDLSGLRDSLIARYNDGASLEQSRSLVLQAMADDAAFKQAQYNSAFVLTEYFAYLKRDPDQEGYRFWLNVLNNGAPVNYRGMVCSFITSAEYQNRFSRMISHSNGECGH